MRRRAESPALPALALLAAAALAGCAGKPKVTGDDAPTLATLAGRPVELQPDARREVTVEQAIAAYKDFIAAAPRAPQQTQALRRLGDLEMDRADERSAAGAGDNPDYREAVARYEALLKAHPQAAGNDRVLYQLARAHEQAGKLELSLRTLDRLVSDFPQTAHREEAQFRRGELLFALRQYPAAEKAYAQVLAGPAGLFRERALYMLGWSQFKQSRAQEALHAFFGVLDATLASRGEVASLAALGEGVSRAERELLEDTLRVTSLCLLQLDGAESIPAYVKTPGRERYEALVWRHLGDFYLAQDRVKDAADTYARFARTHALHAQAPLLQTRVIEIYERHGFATLALQAKKDYAQRYGAASEFRRANPEGWAQAQPLVRQHLAELARHYHALGQKGKDKDALREAERWYRETVTGFPGEAATAPQHFLLAELVYEDGRWADAVREYEAVAYGYPTHAKSADAGYASLLARARRVEQLASGERPAAQREGVTAALRFAERFANDARSAPVLADAADKLYTLGDGERAAEVAQRVLALQPAVAETQRRVAWTVRAHVAFDAGQFAQAEAHYTQALALMPAEDKLRQDLVERQAAAVYKQGEQARAAGQTGDAVKHFSRVAQVAPGAGNVRAAAQYDAAAAMLAAKDHSGAARTLEDFRQRFPGHALQAEVSAKLALAYTELQQWGPAAAEFERVAQTQRDGALAAQTLWHAAELHDKAGRRDAAARVYERLLQQGGLPFARAIEARHRLALAARGQSQAAREQHWQRDLVRAESAGGGERNARTRTLAGQASIALVQPLAEAYRRIALVEPLARQLKAKKAAFQEAVDAYTRAAELGVAEVTTAATLHTADLYRDFGRALLASQRPKKLNKRELEQYDLMLEEQAYPFEEQAIALHEANARRAAEGLYDDSVRASYAALRELRPARWGRSERAEGAAPADAAAARDPRSLTRLGVSLREQGDFARSREAYERAIAMDAAYAPALLNLGILHDLYLGDGARALELYERYLALQPDAQVGKWVAELRNRKTAQTAARKEGSS